MNEEHHNTHSTRIWYPRLQISRKNNMFEMNSNNLLISSSFRPKQVFSFETRFTNNIAWLKRSLVLRQSNPETQYSDQPRELSSDQVSSSSVPDREPSPQFKVPFPPSPLASHHVPKLKPKQFCAPLEVSSLFDPNDDGASYVTSEVKCQGSESDNLVIIRRSDLHADEAGCLETAVDNLGESSLFNFEHLCN